MGLLEDQVTFPDLEETFRRGKMGTQERGIWLRSLETAKGFFVLVVAREDKAREK